MDDDVVQDRLAAYGEAFMSMFDDCEAHREQGQGNRGAPCFPSTSMAEEPEDDTGAEVTPGEHMTPRRSIDVLVKDAKKAKSCLTNPRTPQGRPVPLRLGGERGALPFSDQKTPQGPRTSSRGGATSPWSAPPALELSSDDMRLTHTDFASMQREVELMGGAGLRKEERKRLKARLLERIKAKPEKRHRMSKKIGLPLAQKAAAAEKSARELAIQSGMLQRSGAKKLRSVKKKGSDAGGLRELRGSFKNGVLKIGKTDRGTRRR